MIRKLVCLFGMTLLLCLTAAAQDTPKADAFLGYSYVRARPATSGAPSFNLNGGSGSIAFNATRSLGVVADFGGYHVGQIGGVNVSGTVATYLFGPRLSYRGYDRATPFVQVLFGGAHGSASALGLSSSDNAFAMTAGGGFDVKVTNRIGWRLAQVDYLMTRFKEVSTTGRQTQNNLRVSTGIVFRF